MHDFNGAENKAEAGPELPINLKVCNLKYVMICILFQDQDCLYALFTMIITS